MFLKQEKSEMDDFEEEEKYLVLKEKLQYFKKIKKQKKITETLAKTLHIFCKFFCFILKKKSAFFSGGGGQPSPPPHLADVCPLRMQVFLCSPLGTF